MNKKFTALLIPLMAVALAAALLLIKFMWSWVIPDLFPGAVAQGLVAGEISWFTAFKLAIFVAFFAGLTNSGVQRQEQK